MVGETFCWYFTPRQGTIMIAVLYIIGTACTTNKAVWDAKKNTEAVSLEEFDYFIESTFASDNSTETKTAIRSIRKVVRILRTMDYVLSYGAIVLSVIDFLLSILLLYGASTNCTSKCSPWLYYNILLTFSAGCVVIYLSLFYILLALFVLAPYGIMFGIYVLLGAGAGCVILRYVLNNVRLYIQQVDCEWSFDESPSPTKQKHVGVGGLELRNVVAGPEPAGSVSKRSEEDTKEAKATKTESV